MSRSLSRWVLCLWIGGLCSASIASAGESGAALTGTDPEHIDRLFFEGSEQNYQRSGLEILRQALEACVQASGERPRDYEILWRCARSAYKVGEAAEILDLEGWKEICREWGKKGMEFSERAQQVEPGRVEGYFWETACIGIYADATGALTAVREGFYEKSKRAMAKAYEIDKSYNDCDPVFGSAMFYIALPFPLKDKKKALTFYREFEASTQWRQNPYVRSVHAANLILTVKDGNYREEARRLLEKALSDPHPRRYYAEWARRLKEKLE